jgi:hypothetical protein
MGSLATGKERGRVYSRGVVAHGGGEVAGDPLRIIM